MRIVTEKNYRQLREIKSALCKHIKLNIKDYFRLSVILIIGVLIGAFQVNGANEGCKNEVKGYINSIFGAIKSEGFEVDRIQLMKENIGSNLKLLAMVWISGTTIIGIPMLYVIILYKGISIGYTVSAIMLAVGSWKGLLLSTSAMLLQNIIIIPMILMLNVSSINLYRCLIKKDKGVNLKKEIIRHTILCIILIIPVILVGVISSFVSSSLLLYFTKNMIN